MSRFIKRVRENKFFKEAVQISNLFAYVRVSTKEQNEDRQLIAAREYGVAEERIFRDRQSGKDFDRPAYQSLLEALQPTDILVIKSIDRLGRDYAEIIEQWRYITKELRAAIVVLDMEPLLDTRQRGRDLTGIFIADLVLQILSYVAEMERELNRQRQAEGIAAARARGVRFGRPAIERTQMFYSLRDAWVRKEISGRAAASRLGISPRTFRLWAAER